MRTRTWIGGSAALVLSIGLLVTTWGSARAQKTPDAPMASDDLCNQLWDHVLGVMKANPDLGPDLSAMSAEELEEGRKEFSKECMEQREATVRCMLTKSTDDGFDACIDEHDPEQKLGIMREEPLVNLDGIRTAERAYQAEWDAFTSCAATPTNIPGTEFAPFAGGGIAHFENLGWIADGKVRCRYRVVAITGQTPLEDTFEATAECDFDGNGMPSVYRATRDEKARALTPDTLK